LDAAFKGFVTLLIAVGIVGSGSGFCCLIGFVTRLYCQRFVP